MNPTKPIVAHINHSFFALSETFIYHYISRLRRFTPLCLGWKFCNPHLYKTQKQDMYSLALPWAVLDYAYQWVIRRLLRIDPWAEFCAARVLRQRNASLVHAHFGWNGSFAVKLKRECKIPVITTWYGQDLSVRLSIKRFASRYKILFEEGDLFLVEGPSMRQKLINLGCPEKKIQVQRIALPLTEIPFRVRKQKKAGERVIFIFCGRFIEKKGLLFALQALDRVRSKFSNFEFRIIGHGPQYNEIVNFIQSHKMEKFVKMIGLLRYDNYLMEMLQADIFLHPSVTAANGDSEGGAPTTILEAQATGMPVISSYHADIPSVVVPDKSALLSPERDIDMLALNIACLLDHQDLWPDMSFAGREFVETNHHLEKEVVRLEDRYTSLL